MIRTLTVAMCLVLPQFGLAEIATTEDGRQFLLKEDRTYEQVVGSSSKSSDYIKSLEPMFEKHVSKYQQQSIRFMPVFLNMSEKAIVGIKFSSSFRDAFGETVFQFEGDVSERISPSASSDARVFYVFENNPFMGGEPYDKLLSMISGNTGVIQTTVTKVALEDGTILDFSED